jgi:hypothetical protein
MDPVMTPMNNLVGSILPFRGACRQYCGLGACRRITFSCHPEPFAKVFVCCHPERSEGSRCSAQDRLREGSRSAYNEILRVAPKKQTSGTTDDADGADKGRTSRGVDNIRVIRVIRGQEEAACFFLKLPAPGGLGARNEGQQRN